MLVRVTRQSSATKSRCASRKGCLWCGNQAREEGEGGARNSPLSSSSSHWPVSMLLEHTCVVCVCVWGGAATTEVLDLHFRVSTFPMMWAYFSHQHAVLLYTRTENSLLTLLLEGL